MTTNNFYIIGGQYQAFCYGARPTLIGAKRLATASVEYWDNWQGWYIPKIYRAADIRPCVNFYGETFCPVDGAQPVAVGYYNDGGRVVWEET